MTLSLDRYRLLGRSGLRVSPLCLGTMTFGTEWGWGSDEKESRKVFDKYADYGGNFIDTANAYTNGTSEKMLGTFLKGRRDRFVVATKFTANMQPDDPNAGGNHRKNIRRSVEDSLKRLQTDYIDLYWLHVWDNRAPWEEVMSTLNDLVREGKVNYIGVSDTPAWQVARANTLAIERGWEPFTALQIEYSLIQRTVERDLIPMAREMGLGVTPWSPLAGGVLAGKYTRKDIGEDAKHHQPKNAKGGKNQPQQVKKVAADDEMPTRKGFAIAMGNLSPRGLDITDAVKTVASETGHTPAQVAIRWLLEKPGVASPIIGARDVKQLEDNLGALEIDLTHDQIAFLDRASAIEVGFPHDFLQHDIVRRFVDGDTVIACGHHDVHDRAHDRDFREAAE
ncbi:MAG TPA: aldo/keto reductase [Patescibacteria group bacterium]|nr:aldo/keto reductase [Patescibacteria group bacterium]